MAVVVFVFTCAEDQSAVVNANDAERSDSVHHKGMMESSCCIDAPQ